MNDFSVSESNVSKAVASDDPMTTLNTESILVMTEGPEIDQLIAEKVFGWTTYFPGEECSFFEETIPDPSEEWPNAVKRVHHMAYDFDPSTDLTLAHQAARKVVEKYGEYAFLKGLGVVVLEEPLWMDVDTGWLEIPYSVAVTFALASPLQIVKACLLVVMQEGK